MAGSRWNEKQFVNGSELVNYCKSALENAQASVLIENGLRTEIEKKKQENDLLEAIIKVEAFNSSNLKKKFEDLEKSASRLREENEQLEGKLKFEISERIKVENELKGLNDSAAASRLREEIDLIKGKFEIEVSKRLKAEKEFGELKKVAALLRKEKELIQGKLEIQVSRRSKAETEFGDLKKSGARVREERDGLYKRLKEKEDEGREITELRTENYNLKCAKLKAETDAKVYRSKFKELKGKLLIMDVEKDHVTTPPDHHDHQTNSGKRKVRNDDFGGNANPSTDASSQRKRRTEILPKDRTDHVIRGNSAAAGFSKKGSEPKADTTKSSKLFVNKKPSYNNWKRSNVLKRHRPRKDPNKPKRSPCAFLVFMEEFRETYKKEHPKKKFVGAVGKAAGEKWNSMSEPEKAPFVAESEKRRVEYEKKMKAYYKELQAEEEDSDKSMSEVSDHDDEENNEDEDEDEENSKDEDEDDYE